MGLLYDIPALAPSMESNLQLNKRRRFTPNSLPLTIPVSDSSGIEHHNFTSPLLLQLCEQAPGQAEIEAGLLQVGMRVRKSVAEGYKTHQKKFTPRPFFNMHRLSPETQAALTVDSHPEGTESTPLAAASPNLSTATFCGVSLSFLSKYADDWSSSPSVSQQSLWSCSTSHKRSYEAGSDSEDSQDWQPRTPNLVAEAGVHMPVDFFAIDMDTMDDVSTMTQLGDPPRQATNGRRMAMPRSRIRTRQPQMPSTPAVNPFANMTVQQPEPSLGSQFVHQRMVSCGMEAAMDFGDAPFLQRREDVEMDCS